MPSSKLVYSLLLLSPPFTAGAVRSWSDKCMRIVLDIEEEDIERITKSLDNQ
jgi:hypothetical protein